MLVFEGFVISEFYIRSLETASDTLKLRWMKMLEKKHVFKVDGYCYCLPRKNSESDCVEEHNTRTHWEKTIKLQISYTYISKHAHRVTLRSDFPRCTVLCVRPHSTWWTQTSDWSQLVLGSGFTSSQFWLQWLGPIWRFFFFFRLNYLAWC